MTPHTLQAIQQLVGEVSSALYADRDMGLDIPDGDGPGSRFGALAGILAERLDTAYAMFDPFVWAEMHPPDTAPQEETPGTPA